MENEKDLDQEQKEIGTGESHNGKAIASLVCGMISLLQCALGWLVLVLGTVAIILGITVRRMIRKSGNAKGRNKAAWGIGLGIAGISLWIVSAVLALGIVKFAEQAQEESPIYWAVAADDLDKLRNLIDEGEDVNCKGLMGHTPLIHAARTDSIEAAKLLLEAGASPNLQDDLKWAPLHHAILLTRYHNEIILLLLKYGADVNITDSHKRTPLHRAAQFGYIKAVRLLLDHGADPVALDENGLTPANRAARHPEIVSLLNDRK